MFVVLLFAGMFIQSNVYAQPPSLPVFIQPYDKCLEDKNTGEEVCTKVYVGGCAPEGLSFAKYGSCDAVKAQRPFYERPPYQVTDPTDDRLNDEGFLNEYKWLTKQVRSCGCVCCHDSQRDLDNPEVAGWDIDFLLDDDGKPSQIWTDHLSDRGVAIFAGALETIQEPGFYTAEENNGFSMDKSAMPSTDKERLKDYFDNEIARRRISQKTLDAMPPVSFSGGRMVPIVLAQKPVPCTKEQGVDADGRISWQGEARYIYLLRKDATNPTVPPVHDTPEGTIWRIDRDHRLDALTGSVAYGEVPAGMWQKFPRDGGPPPALVIGEVYKLYVTKDVLQPIINCTFTFGDSG